MVPASFPPGARPPCPSTWHDAQTRGGKKKSFLARLGYPVPWIQRTANSQQRADSREWRLGTARSMPAPRTRQEFTRTRRESNRTRREFARTRREFTRTRREFTRKQRESTRPRRSTTRTRLENPPLPGPSLPVLHAKCSGRRDRRARRRLPREGVGGQQQQRLKGREDDKRRTYKKKGQGQRLRLDRSAPRPSSRSSTATNSGEAWEKASLADGSPPPSLLFSSGLSPDAPLLHQVPSDAQLDPPADNTLP